MDTWILLYLAVYCGGTAVSLLLTPLFGALAGKTGFMDVPAANHKQHGKATPLLGGAAMFCSWIIIITAGFIGIKSGYLPDIPVLSELSASCSSTFSSMTAVIAGAALAVLLGAWDDKYALSALSKFGGQFVIALLVTVWGGVRLNIFLENQYIVSAVTVFWIMLMMNSINFFDNMDGLAAGVIAIALGIFGIIGAINGQYMVALNAVLCCGICCGFWFYNAAPAKIFMGDSGSHFLGLLAAVTAAEVSFFDISYSLSRFPILIPLLVLALPLFDTCMVVIIRTLNRKPFWIGDHNHISHRFVRMGLSRPTAVLLVHLLALSIGITAFPIFRCDFLTAAILVFQVILLLAVITILQFTLGNSNSAGKK